MLPFWPRPDNLTLTLSHCSSVSILSTLPLWLSPGFAVPTLTPSADGTLRHHPSLALPKRRPPGTRICDGWCVQDKNLLLSFPCRQLCLSKAASHFWSKLCVKYIRFSGATRLLHTPRPLTAEDKVQIDVYEKKSLTYFPEDILIRNYSKDPG